MTETAKPKIAVLADTYYPKIDGVLRFIEEFIKRAKQEFDLHLVAPNFSSELRFAEIKTTLLDLSKFKFFNYNSIKLSMNNRKQIKTVIKESDLVFVQDAGPIGHYALKYAKRLSKKSVIYFHTNAWEFMQKYFTLNKLAAKISTKFLIKLHNKADLVMIPYLKLKEQLQTAGIKSKMEVCQLGVNTEKFSPSKDKKKLRQNLGLPDKTIIGYTGRVSNEKNINTLLRAFTRLNNKKIFLLIVGDGDKNLVEKLREIPNCRVTGFVDNPYEYMQAMDIFVMPSFTETTSLATLEAMSTGLAVIASKVGFIETYLVKDHNGLFFPKTSAATLAAKIDKLIKNPELRHKLGVNARKTAEFSFSWDKSISKIIQVLKDNVKAENSKNKAK